MAKLTYETTMSLDGCTTGPEIDLENPLGVGGHRLHEWMFGLRAFEEPHGESGGETGPDDDLLRKSFEANGAMIMGRLMYSGGSGPWEDDPNANGWWGDEPPFGVPVFVLTHHARETLPMKGGTTFHFVTGGIEAALEQAHGGGRRAERRRRRRRERRPAVPEGRAVGRAPDPRDAGADRRRGAAVR